MLQHHYPSVTLKSTRKTTITCVVWNELLTERCLLSFNSPMFNGCFQATLVFNQLRVQNQTGLIAQMQLSFILIIPNCNLT